MQSLKDWPARAGADPRLNVYRGAVHATLCDALAALYPAVVQLVDVRFFRQTARQYLRACPLSQGDQRGFGSDFPQFLDSLRALRSLPYVPDLARLEWALHEVEHAPADPHEFDLSLLGRVTDAEWRRLRFRLHRATALVTSGFPVLQIWEAHRDGTPRPEVIPDRGSTHLLVVRTSDCTVGTRPLSVGEYTLLQAFATGRALEDAHRLVMDVDPKFDLSRTLARFIAQDVITGFRPAPV
jgi:hypothetical protein